MLLYSRLCNMIVMSVSVDFFKFMTFRGQRFFKQLRWCWRTKAYSTSCLQTAHLSPAFSPQFSVEMCAASKNCEKFTKTSFLRGSRSFKAPTPVPGGDKLCAAYSEDFVILASLHRFYWSTRVTDGQRDRRLDDG